MTRARHLARTRGMQRRRKAARREAQNRAHAIDKAFRMMQTIIDSAAQVAAIYAAPIGAGACAAALGVSRAAEERVRQIGHEPPPRTFGTKMWRMR